MGPSHEDEECPEDMEMEDLLNAAAEKKWQRCYSCRRMVELTIGCNHISMFWPFESLYGFTQLTICQHVAAKPNFATAAACNGGNVNVPFGMKID